MPHINVYGSNTQLCMQSLHIHATIKFRQDYFNTVKADAKMKELKQELEAIVEKYFGNDMIEGEELTNHEWNLKMNNR